MFEVIKPLLESGIINEATGHAINEAWEAKLNEAREQVRAELREEFSQKYDHDRQVIVEALDRMMDETLQEEMAELQYDRKKLKEERAQVHVKLKEHAKKFNEFMVKHLAEEIKGLRQDRKVQLESQKKIQQFVVHNLAKELKEFTTDKKAVVEAKVKLVAEGKRQLNALKTRFVKENAVRVGKLLSKGLQSEIHQLKEDIKVARENNFGRKIFESFASEFSVTHLNSKAETRKLMSELYKRDVVIAESADQVKRMKLLAENKDRELRILKESNLREKTMTELLAPLNKEKAEVMKNLLESVQTNQLSKAFDKYLPAVLNTGTQTNRKSIISESVQEVTGNKTAKVKVEVEGRDNVIDLKRLAGL